MAQAFDTSQADVDRVTADILGDLFFDGSFAAAFDDGDPLLNPRERSHMHDVAMLVRLLAMVALIAFSVAVTTGIALRGETRRRGRVMLIAATAVGAVALLLGITFAVAFEEAFLAFHSLFFPPGTYLFEPGSNLITLFPQGFWFDASLAAGGTILLAAVIVLLLGWRGVRSAPTTAADS